MVFTVVGGVGLRNGRGAGGCLRWTFPDRRCECVPQMDRSGRRHHGVFPLHRRPLRHGMAFHQLHGSPAAAVAVYDPRLGAVIVASHNPEYQEGQVLEVPPPN